MEWLQWLELVKLLMVNLIEIISREVTFFSLILLSIALGSLWYYEFVIKRKLQEEFSARAPAKDSLNLQSEKKMRNVELKNEELLKKVSDLEDAIRVIADVSRDNREIYYEKIKEFNQEIERKDSQLRSLLHQLHSAQDMIVNLEEELSILKKGYKRKESDEVGE